MLRLRRFAVVLAVAVSALVVVSVVAATVPAAKVPVQGTLAMATESPAPATESPASRTPVTSADRAPVATPAREPIVRGITAIVPGSVDRTSLALTAEYDVSLSLNFGTRAFKVDSTMTVRNDSGGPIDRLELNTIAARLGAMKLGEVTVGGKTVKATVSDQTIVVPLGGILGAGQSVPVRVRYSAALRSSTTGSNWMFTRTNGIVDAYRWIPWVSKRLAFDRPNHGDPFETPVTPRIRVVITSDRSLVFATTGERVAVSGLRQTFEASNVRDFVFAAAPDYKSISTTLGDNVIRVYYRPGAPASAILAAAKHAIAKMEPLVGPYPYRTYDLAQTAGGFGMEAPGLTWIPTGVGSANLSYLVHHETGHQWFYGIVGNDQANEPFTDEAATDFLARYALGQRRSSRCSTARLDLSIYRYSSACYYEVIYIQGGNFLDDLRRKMGNTAFWSGMRAYVAANRFKLAPTKTLLDTLDAHTPLNLVPRFHPRFPRLY
jgi:aminopeptidase N